MPVDGVSSGAGLTAGAAGRSPSLAAAALFFALLFALWGAAGVAVAQPKPETVAACVACHGAGGNSTVLAVPSIAAQPRTFLENQLVLIREGLRDVPTMKAVMGALGDAEITALARHFSAQPAVPATGTAQPDKARAGADISRRALCAGCHMPGYVGQGQVPRLAGQQEVYLRATLKMYRDKPEPGRDTLMSAPLQGMNDVELENLAHHLAYQGR